MLLRTLVFLEILGLGVNSAPPTLHLETLNPRPLKCHSVNTPTWRVMVFGNPIFCTCNPIMTRDLHVGYNYTSNGLLSTLNHRVVIT